MPIRFSSKQEARDYSQGVPVLRLSTMRVSISPHARKYKRLFFAPVYYINIQFETNQQEAIVIGGYEFYDRALTMLDTDPDHVLIGDNGPPFLMGGGFPGVYAGELRDAYHVTEDYLALTSADCERIIATVAPHEIPMLRTWLARVVS